MGWGLAGTGNSSAVAAAIVVAAAPGWEWKSQNRVGVLESRLKSGKKSTTSTKHQKLGI